MPVPKTGALPLGYTPAGERPYSRAAPNVKGATRIFARLWVLAMCVFLRPWSELADRLVVPYLA